VPQLEKESIVFLGGRTRKKCLKENDANGGARLKKGGVSEKGHYYSRKKGELVGGAKSRARKETHRDRRGLKAAVSEAPGESGAEERLPLQQRKYHALTTRDRDVTKRGTGEGPIKDGL